MTRITAVLCGVVLVFAGISLGEDGGGSRDFRVGELIIGGTDTAENEFPFQVMLKRYGIFNCGGTILGRRHVLTAAHCVDDGIPAGLYTVVAGDRNRTDHGEPEQHLAAKKIFLHERFDISTAKYDIAIVKLDGALRYTPSVQPVALSTASFDRYAKKSNDCWAMGYGYTTQEPSKEAVVLQKMNTDIIGNKICKAIMPAWGYTVHTKNVCTLDVGKSICVGDSGGALGCYSDSGVFKQVGFTSWKQTYNCTLGPSVFTRVSKYRRWIRDTMDL